MYRSLYVTQPDTARPSAPGVHRVALLLVSCAALALLGACSDASHAERQEHAQQSDGRATLSEVAAPDAVAAFVEGLRLKTLGRVLGQVDAAPGSPPVALPGATVGLEDARGQSVGATAQSDVEGHYEIPSHPPGTYQLCAQAPGLAETCAPEPMVIAADTQYLHFNLTLR